MQMMPLKSLARIEPNNVFNLTEIALVGCSRLTINKYTAEYNAYQKAGQFKLVEANYTLECHHCQWP
jgi:hypothetical protein